MRETPLLERPGKQGQYGEEEGEGLRETVLRKGRKGCHFLKTASRIKPRGKVNLPPSIFCPC